MVKEKDRQNNIRDRRDWAKYRFPETLTGPLGLSVVSGPAGALSPKVVIKKLANIPSINKTAHGERTKLFLYMLIAKFR